VSVRVRRPGFSHAFAIFSMRIGASRVFVHLKPPPIIAGRGAALERIDRSALPVFPLQACTRTKSTSGGRSRLEIQDETFSSRTVKKEIQSVTPTTVAGWSSGCGARSP
jgi:hypothetical protein